MRTNSTRSLNGGMIDTTFVLFFLAVELGTGGGFAETLLSFITLASVVVLPYFLIENDDASSLMAWIVGRSSLAVFGVLVGVPFGQAVGSILPQSAKYLPMTFLILSAAVSCYVQIYSLTKPRLAK